MQLLCRKRKVRQPISKLGVLNQLKCLGCSGYVAIEDVMGWF